MAQLIIKHVSYLRRAPSIYFHLSDRDGCTNSVSAINKGSINIGRFLQKQITQLINCPVTVNNNNPKINKEATLYSLVSSPRSIFSPRVQSELIYLLLLHKEGKYDRFFCILQRVSLLFNI